MDNIKKTIWNKKSKMLPLLLSISFSLAAGFLSHSIPRQNALYLARDDLSLGAPMARPESGHFTSPTGVRVDFQVQPLTDPQAAIDSLVTKIDNELGVLLTSSYEVLY
jgi:hypothetical protein